jgi:hypothetical protein
VVSRWACHAKRIFCLLCKQLVNGKTGRSTAAQGGVYGAGGKPGIRVQGQPVDRRVAGGLELDQSRPVGRLVNPLHLLRCRQRCRQELRARNAFDGPEHRGDALGALGMARSRVVPQAIVMMNDECFHSEMTVLSLTSSMTT